MNELFLLMLLASKAASASGKKYAPPTLTCSPCSRSQQWCLNFCQRCAVPLSYWHSITKCLVESRKEKWCVNKIMRIFVSAEKMFSNRLQMQRDNIHLWEYLKLLYKLILTQKLKCKLHFFPTYLILRRSC